MERMKTTTMHSTSIPAAFLSEKTKTDAPAQASVTRLRNSRLVSDFSIGDLAVVKGLADDVNLKSLDEHKPDKEKEQNPLSEGHLVQEERFHAKMECSTSWKNARAAF